MKASVEERKKETQEFTPEFPEEVKLDFIYSPIESRYIVKVLDGQDEYLILEIGYAPVGPLLQEIEKLAGKEIRLQPNHRIYVKTTNQHNHERIQLQQYSPEKKKSITVFSTKYNEMVLKLLRFLEEFWNSYQSLNESD